MKGKKDSWQKGGSNSGNRVNEIESSKCVHLFVSHLLSYDTFFHSGSSLQAFLHHEIPTTCLIHPAILGEVRIAMLVVHQFCSTIDLGKALNSIMLIKMNSLESSVLCHKVKFSEKILQNCKFPHIHYNKEHSSSSWFPQMSFLFNCYFKVLVLCVCKSLKRNIMHLTITHFS